MPYIQGDVATTIAVTRLIAEYLESSDEVMLPSRVEAIILQNVLQWLHTPHRGTDLQSLLSWYVAQWLCCLPVSAPCFP